MDEEIQGQEVMSRFIALAKLAQSMDDLKDLRNKIAAAGAEGFLFPLTRALDAVLTGNSFWIEILTPEVKGISDLFIELWSERFRFELKDKKVTAEERKRLGYKMQYSFQSKL